MNKLLDGGGLRHGVNDDGQSEADGPAFGSLNRNLSDFGFHFATRAWRLGSRATFDRLRISTASAWGDRRFAYGNSKFRTQDAGILFGPLELTAARRTMFALRLHPENRNNRNRRAHLGCFLRPLTDEPKVKVCGEQRSTAQIPSTDFCR
jgi:hypothetical protein